MQKNARVVLVHAVAVAMDPILNAFREGWPEVEVANILDDSLSPDRAAETEIGEGIASRISALTEYAYSANASGILFTCSAFGPAIERAAKRVPVPVLKPNEAMFEEAIQCGNKIGMIATFEPAVASMEQEFREQAAALGSHAGLRTVVARDALAALKRGDPERHNELVAQAAQQLSECDAIILAQFSTSVAAPAVRGRLGAPVFTSPESAVRKVKRLILERERRVDDK